MDQTQQQQRRRLLVAGLIILIAASLALIIWLSVFKRPFVEVVIPSGADRAVLGQVINAKSTKITVKENGRIRLATGDYMVTYYKGDQAVGLDSVTVKPQLSQSVSQSLTPASRKLATIMHNQAKLVTPFNGGYLFQDTRTQGVSFIDANGIQDMSESFLLTTSAYDPENPDGFNTVIAIQPVKGGVAVTTTAAVFMAKNLTDITRLTSSDQEFLNFTSSSYDHKTNRLFVLSSYKKEVFYYDLSELSQGPKVLYTADRDINRVTAGGGRFAVYFDDVPAADTETLDVYGLTRQLAPVIGDSQNGKIQTTLNDFRAPTLAAISEDGRYIVLKQKFATSMDILEIGGGGRLSVPAPDTNALLWKGSDLYFGRTQGLWKVSPATSGEIVSLAATAGENINWLAADGDGLLAGTTTNFVAKLVANDIDVDNLLAEKMKSIALGSEEYFITYADILDKFQVSVLTYGRFELGMDEAQLAASQAPAYQEALQAIRSLPEAAALPVAQRDGSVASLYQYAGFPVD